MGQFRQSVFGRLAGYEDVNDADRLGVDPAMRWIVGGAAVTCQAASTSQMVRFETEVLAREANVTALADLSGRWIDAVHARRRPMSWCSTWTAASVPRVASRKAQPTTANPALQRHIAHLLKRPVGRSPSHVRRLHASFRYQAGSWSRKRRVVAKVEWHPGELYPRVGFIVTNLTRGADRVVVFYNQRGTAEQYIREGKNAVRWTRLSCRTMRGNAVRLQLHALAGGAPRPVLPYPCQHR